MTGVLVWKELREQATSALALVLLGSAVIIGVYAWGPAGHLSSSPEPVFVLPLILTWICGLVVGVQPFAAERENGTLIWLDTLPANRRQIWNGKTLAAVSILGLQSLILLGLGGGLGFYGHVRGEFGQQPFSIVLAFLAFPLSGFAFGMLGSSMGNSPLAAIGWAILGGVICAPVFALVQALVPHQLRSNWPADGLVFALFWVVPTYLSYRVFSRLDRLRSRRVSAALSGPRPWWALLWLAWRQVRWLHLAVLIAGLLIASVLPRSNPFIWPFFACAFGAMLGIGAFAPDNIGGSARFLGERRLPLGRLWIVKAGAALLSLMLIVGVLMLNLELAYVARMYSLGGGRQFGIWEAMGFDAFMTPGMILLGPAYGFAVGLLFGMVCRKGAVAAVLTLLTAACLLAFWLPSMAMGGVTYWQILGPPLVLIAATRLATRPWTAGRLTDWRPAMGIAGAVLLAIGGVALGLWWRVTEIPAVGAPFDVNAFVASAPTPEQNQGGRKTRLAALEFESLWSGPVSQQLDPPTEPETVAKNCFQEVAEAVNESAWPVGKHLLDNWMDRVFAEKWFPVIREAAVLPRGVVASPWPPKRSSGDPVYVPIQQICVLLCGRALQFQARKQPAEALAMYRLALAATGQMRPRAAAFQYLSANRSEMTVLRLLPTWAAANVNQPELLRQAIKMLQEGEAAIPPLTETIKTEYLIARDDSNLLDESLYPAARESLAQLRQFARFAPWERDRTDRILNWLFAGWMRTAALDYKTALEEAEPAAAAVSRPPPFQAWLPPVPSSEGLREREKLRKVIFARHATDDFWYMDELFSAAPLIQARWRAAQLQIALLLYEHEHSKSAPKLEDLVPAILPEVPVDPFSNVPFRYRVSKGEQINMRPEAQDERGQVTVEPGQGVIWSVSTNLTDDGGVRNGGMFGLFGRGQAGLDLIFIVPRPAKK